MNLQDVIKYPVVSEKAEAMQAQNCYVFEVDRRANKTLVAKAIHEIYGFSPVKVNVVNTRPKAKRNRFGVGFTPVRKKAYVFLKDSDKITLFEAV
ncbi:MAG: 50S ribosomal protein L23 [Leptospiraceae bacterium]|nr:50S ribosomal protein L23 [Leptospiraceae bacterium]